MKKHEIDPVWTFEQVLNSHWFASGRDWRKYYHVRWPQQLVAQGLLRSRRPREDEQNLKEYLFFEPTEAGIQWWFGERVKLHDEKYYGKLDVNRLAEPSANNPPMVEGKGIGGRLRASHQSQIGPMFKGLQDGLFKFVHYWSCPWYGEQTLTVELTEKGMRYFDSLPKLMLECA